MFTDRPRTYKHCGTFHSQVHNFLPIPAESYELANKPAETKKKTIFYERRSKEKSTTSRELFDSVPADNIAYLNNPKVGRMGTSFLAQELEKVHKF